MARTNTNTGGGGLTNVSAGTRIVIDYTDPLDPEINWVPNVFSNYSASTTVVRGDENIELSTPLMTTTLPDVTGYNGEVHTLVNTSNSTQTIDTTGGQYIGNRKNVSTLIMQPYESIKVIADGIGGWLLAHVRNASNRSATVTPGNVVNVSSVSFLSYRWSLCDEVVTFSGQVSISASTPGAYTSVEFTPADVQSMFSSLSDASGTVYVRPGGAQTYGGTLEAVPATSKMIIEYFSSVVGDDIVDFSGSYSLI